MRSKSGTTSVEKEREVVICKHRCKLFICRTLYLGETGEFSTESTTT
jgi:hypothetical protein